MRGSSTRWRRVFCGHRRSKWLTGVFTVRLFNEPLAAGADAAPETAGLANTRLADLREHFLRHPSLTNADYREDIRHQPLFRCP